MWPPPLSRFWRQALDALATEIARGKRWPNGGRGNSPADGMASNSPDENDPNET